MPDAYGRIAAAYAACGPQLITSVDLLPARNANSVRFRLTLSDGSRLHVSEEWRQGLLSIPQVFSCSAKPVYGRLIWMDNRLSRAKTRENIPKRCTVYRTVCCDACVLRGRVQQHDDPGPHTALCGGLRGSEDGVCDRVYACALLQRALVERAEAELSAG